jgi:hypothetical protein
VSLFEAPNTQSFDLWKRSGLPFMRPREIEHW